MIEISRRAGVWPLLTIALLAATTPASSQAPTDAQRAAIKSQCRSDYIAHCSSIPPGGAASLQCLQKNMASLSASCQSAVRAVEASVEKSEPKAEAKPKPTPEPAPEPPTAKPAEPSAAAPKPATESATTAAKPAAETPTAPAAKTTAAKSTAGAVQGKPSDAQIAAIRSACRSDYPKVCAGVPTGGAPALQCLEKNKSKVSASCQQAVNAAGGGAAAPAAAGAAATAAPGAAPAAAPAPVLVLRPM